MFDLAALLMRITRSAPQLYCCREYPPIDDDEFIRRCRPGVNREVALRVRRIISDSLGIDYERIYPEHRFVDDLGC